MRLGAGRVGAWARPRTLVRLAGVAAVGGLASLGAPAWAGIPAALDRVPTDAPLVMGVDNLDNFTQRSRALLSALGSGAAADDNAGAAGAGLPGTGMLRMLDRFDQVQGLNRAGSAAVYTLAQGDGADAEAPAAMFFVLPVTNFAEFVASMGGDAGEQAAGAAKGVHEIKIGNRSDFARDIGNGYALVGPDAQLLADVTPATGQLATHTARLGVVGGQVAEQTELLAIAHVPALGDRIRDGYEQRMRGMQGMMGMAGAVMDPRDVRAFVESARAVVDNFARDAEVAILGVGLSDAGVSIDLAAQFKADSQLAGYMASPGDTAPALGLLQQGPFLFAAGVDTRAAGVKHILGEVLNGPGGGDEAEAEAGGLAGALPTTDRLGLLVSASRAGMQRGLLSQTTFVVGGSDVKALHAIARKGIEQAGEDQASPGAATKVTYTESSDTVAGVQVDGYSIVPAQGANPDVAFIQGFLVSPTTRGFVAPLENAVITTTHNNKLLLQQTIQASQGKGATFAQATDVQGIQALLPKDRSIEAYVGAKPLLQFAVQAMSLQGAAVEWTAPDTLSPIGLGVATRDAGFHARLVLPTDVVRTLTDFQEALRPLREQRMGQPPRAPQRDQDAGAPDSF